MTVVTTFEQLYNTSIDSTHLAVSLYNYWQPLIAIKNSKAEPYGVAVPRPHALCHMRADIPQAAKVCLHCFCQRLRHLAPCVNCKLIINSIS